MELSFNARQVQPNTTLEPVPSDTYVVMITNSVEKPVKNSSDGSSYLELEQTIQEGPYKGRKVFDRLNLKNKSEPAREIAYRTLSAICYVTQRLEIQRSQQLHGVPFRVVVAKQPRNDTPPNTPPDQIQFTNAVKGYKDMQGNDPGMGGKPAGGGQPAWAGNGQQQGAGGGGETQVNNSVKQTNNGGGAPAWAQGGGNGGGAAPAQQHPSTDQSQQQAAEDTRPPWARG